ncbi:hypothetical protein [Longitalea luteola]|uniref:hypothetical protein n=1 Tax=Longitalea luteola TaxID=2812563 RepID=UPI001A97C5F3|nr:hypothetical protein [Longitalea luteola]
MKKLKQLLAITGSALIIASCQDADNQSDVTEDTLATQESVDTTHKPNTQYVDLKTGQPVDLYYNPRKKRTYSESTNEPVDLYVNVATGDTIYGQGRYVVNGYIVKTEDGTYKLDNKKIKIDGDEIKIKEGDKKFKMEDGEMKIKDGDVKAKADEDGTKLKTEDMKMKKE